MKKLLILLILFGCPSNIMAAETDILQEIIIKDGDTLWSVANKYLQNPQSWPELLKYNKLPTSDPNVILPGMRMNVPLRMIKEQFRSAKLIKLINSVLYRKSKQANWDRAYVDMTLYSDDGLRTMSESIASVKFYSGEIIKLDENSLVILRPEQKTDEVELLNGAVRASKSKVISADSEVMPQITPKGAKPDYKTKIKPDKTTLVEVYEGIVDVTAQGKTVTLSKGFGTEVKYLSAPADPHKLPPQIMLDSNSPQSIKNDGEFKLPILPKDTQITSSASGKDKNAQIIGNILSKFHIQITSDKNFENMVFDKVYDIEKSDFNFKKLNIADGKYFYRISYIDELGLEGPFSNANTLILDITPPKINVSFPAENEYVDKEFIILRGESEPDSKIVVDDEIAPINTDGTFNQTISVRKGKNTVKIEVTDTNGNVNLLSRTFFRGEKGKIGSAKSFQDPGEKKSKFSLTPASIGLGLLSISVILGVVFLIFA